MNVAPCTTISLCSGIAGLDLGVHAALRRLGQQPRTVCYVEREVFPASILAARMAEGALDEAPIWTDLHAFNGRPWRGRVRGLFGGIPCQPFSTAGDRDGDEDERWLWPRVASLLDEVRPEWFFLENVAGLLSCQGGRPFAEILRGLGEGGFDAAWKVHRASDEGAPHGRARVFLLAMANTKGRKSRPSDYAQGWHGE